MHSRHRLVAAAWADLSDTALPCCPLSVVASALLRLSLPPAARRVTFALTEPCPLLPRSGGLTLDRCCSCPSGVPGAAELTMRAAHDRPTAICRSRLAVVSSFCFPVCANTWHRLPVFSIGARYQPGAARQKEAGSPTTAPCWNPRGRRPVRVQAFLTRRSVHAGFFTPSKTERRHLAAHTRRNIPCPPHSRTRT